MLTDTQKYNESIKPNSKEIEILKKYFPQCFSKPETDENGAIIKEHFDTEKLAELLNKDEVDIKKEGFTLNFLGKSYARYQANLDSETVIVPDEQNAHIQSENVYIVGDNLDALQHLKYSYAEKIKCIYIDPPYNTGKDDFVYNDKFGFTAKELVEKLDVTEEEAERLCGMNGKCTHSAWLTFMYPRLALARELLRDDSVIFISIDDNEQANLKRLCDEVFGEGNFVAEFIWKSKLGKVGTTSIISSTHEYILCYAKNIEFTKFLMIRNESTGRKENLRQWGVADRREDRPSMFYPITIQGKEVYPIKEDGSEGRWRVGREMAEELLKAEQLELSEKDGKFNIYRIFSESISYTSYDTLLLEKIGTTAKGALLLSELGLAKIFDFSKPVELIQHFIKLSASISYSDSDIILDFFSGSATTAHAVMQLNAQDGGKRKFIMVQLDEHVKKGSEAEKAGYKTIDEIGRERIRRAAEKIKAENPETKADLGFQTFYLKSMPQNTLDKIKTFDPNSLFTSDGDIVKTLGEDTLLQTWQIKDGFGFNCNHQKIDIAGCASYLLEDEKIGKYLYLLTGMEEKSVKELIRKIESFELTVDKIFVYGYSFDFDALNSLSTNLKTLKNRNPIEPIIRY